MLLPWVLCGILSAAVIVMCVKIHILRKSTAEICSELRDRLDTDTNTLISVSSNDRHVKRLAVELNMHLRRLREQRHKYQAGDRELKEAVTNISHDLRTPLTAICGYLDLLKDEVMSDDARRYLSCIENRIQALKKLTEELFRYSVIVSGSEDMSFETVVINDVLEESIASFYAALTGRGITPVIRITEKKIARRLDRDALSRIFGNILGNALKYSGGDLEISLSDSGEIIFENTAEGLNEVQVGKLFDRFFTVEAARNSTGLGLAISKTLVERMNGTITARCNDGKLKIHVEFRQ
jgi:signal transduction histidine kinase